jgi:DNA polymerase III sliding clamp (beta) subunit (PCNA family)
MNLNNANLKVVAAASTDELRRGLVSIHVTPEGTEATNGHILARVGLPYQYEPDDIPATCPTEAAANLKSFVIPAGAVKSLKTFKAKNLPALNNTLFVDVAKTNANGTAHFTATDREQISSPTITKLDTEFPDTSRVIPTDEPAYRVGFNIEYLKILLDIAKATGAETVTVEGYSNITQTVINLVEALAAILSEDTADNRRNASLALSAAEHIPSNCKPWIIRTEHDSQKFTGLIMPIRL